MLQYLRQPPDNSETGSYIYDVRMRKIEFALSWPKGPSYSDELWWVAFLIANISQCFMQLFINVYECTLRKVKEKSIFTFICLAIKLQR